MKILKRKTFTKLGISKIKNHAGTDIQNKKQGVKGEATKTDKRYNHDSKEKLDKYEPDSEDEAAGDGKWKSIDQVNKQRPS